MKTSSGRRGANRTVMPTWYRAPSAPAANRPAHGTPQQAPGGGTAAHTSSRHPSSPGSMRTPHSQHTSPRARIQQAPAYERPPRAAANGPPGIPFSGEVGAKCEQPASTSPENSTGLSANPVGQQFLFPLPAISEPHDTCLPRNLIRQFPHRSKAESLGSASFQFATFRHLPCPRHPRSQPPGVRRAHPADDSGQVRTPAGARESAHYACAPSPARYALSSASRAPRASSSWAICSSPMASESGLAASHTTYSTRSI